MQVPDMPAAARALGQAPRRVLLTIGRKDLHYFAAEPQHDYLVRSIEPIDSHGFPRIEHISDRGPFDEDREMELLLRRGIEVLVSKNSGGTATEPKLAAARALKLPVIMVARPQGGPSTDNAVVTSTVEEALEWLNRHQALRTERGV
jgi:precorrin-6A/cobalt-precorrin-6A reductase